jgi:tRNA nucleotidyltransferase (CCA-adding enzyme)
MREMVKNGEVDALVPERVWKETLKALESTHPRRFFESLKTCGALEKLFPEIDCLFGVPQPAHFHPEIDSGIHTMMVLEQATRLSDDPEVRFAALVHDLGKGTTPKEMLPSHREHEIRGVPLVNNVCDRLRIPNNFRSLALVVTEYHLFYHRADELRASTFVKLFNSLDGFRRPNRFTQFLLTCEADSRGRSGYEDRPCEQTAIFQAAFDAASNVEVQPLIEKGLKGEAVKLALHELRTKAVAKTLK